MKLPYQHSHLLALHQSRNDSNCPRNDSSTNHGRVSRRGGNGTSYQCHLLDEAYSLKKDDYVTLYDGTYGTNNSEGYQRFQIVPMPFPNMVGLWKSSTVRNTNQRVWNHEVWCSDLLYALGKNKVEIQVKAGGNYRIHSRVAQNTSSNTAGYSALYVNGKEYSRARFGASGGTYYQTTHIQEIVRLEKGDKIYVYLLHPYHDQNSNSLCIEKLY